ncbi:MAG: DNA polymerase III subunit chi [Zoogloeaceae bacterium]|jgi:DNA polymerase-3 subunit chi|nr:DNA polymerase III subunit chi [Zoogloeaceae bacterium]
MTRVFFYHNLRDRLGGACALITRAWAEGKDFTLYIPDSERAQFVDRLLWVQPAQGFLPHCRADSPLAEETPVLIATDAAALEHLPSTHSHERLLNLDDVVPPGFGRYANVIEVVGREDSDREAARMRARTYKAQGCDLQFIDRMEH